MSLSISVMQFDNLIKKFLAPESLIFLPQLFIVLLLPGIRPHMEGKQCHNMQQVFGAKILQIGNGVISRNQFMLVIMGMFTGIASGIFILVNAFPISCRRAAMDKRESWISDSRVFM